MAPKKEEAPAEPVVDETPAEPEAPAAVEVAPEEPAPATDGVTANILGKDYTVDPAKGYRRS